MVGWAYNWWEAATKITTGARPRTPQAVIYLRLEILSVSLAERLRSAVAVRSPGSTRERERERPRKQNLPPKRDRLAPALSYSYWFSRHPLVLRSHPRPLPYLPTLLAPSAVLLRHPAASVLQLPHHLQQNSFTTIIILPSFPSHLPLRNPETLPLSSLFLRRIDRSRQGRVVFLASHPTLGD